MPTDHTDPFIVLTRDGARLIANSTITAGDLTLRYTSASDTYVVHSVENARHTRIQADIPREYTALRSGETRHAGQWMNKAGSDIHLHHLVVLRRPGTAIRYEAFRAMAPGVRDPSTGLGLLITYDPDLDPQLRAAGAAEFAGWLIERDGVRPIQVVVEPATLGIAQLRNDWPVDLLTRTSVMLVGCGSIGGAAAQALAAYGIGNLHLVDPDRFVWHNIVRHVLGPESVSRYKVDALKSRHNQLWPQQTVTAHRLDVVDGAHHIRSLIDSVDIVVCTADGIAPRRVVSHLGRRAYKPAVLACVLDQGSLGEVLRLRPTPRFGCLLCSRQHLANLGAIDTEADQELDYGTGNPHQPMTAIPPDLHLIGTLAAKVAVATILESLHGDHTQRLPGEHAIIGLHPANNLTTPFDLTHAADLRWATIPPPRSACPTCNPTSLS
ncbi:ThiF family adenylyltransferase [Nocardia mikamii]|uniref:ThiF family adenylyltransferase n=1 Tax=Nocardia mikamii TaxID=508464 RepID=UPI0007A565FD|nr:ThiF family adenylyltransferase [Nocardia mikamii]